jgi:heterodisulfide reductase subunit A
LLHQSEIEIKQTVNQYHLYRDIRTYGNLETVYEEARHSGALFLRWDPDNPPLVEKVDGRLLVKVKDTLDGGEEIEVGGAARERQAQPSP